MVEVTLQDKVIHNYPDRSAWDNYDGMLIIFDDDGCKACYNIGQWVYVRKVLS